MQSNFIAYKISSIHYCRYGEGKQLLFCFHGYGENAASFAVLEDKLGKDYTLIAIDMPFHGQTQWNEGLLFTPADLVAIIRQIQSANLHRSPLGQPISKGAVSGNETTNHPINLLGYSMGGRIALQLLQTIPASISRVVLVAPDGLHKNPWYTFSTQTYIGNKVFSRVVYKPAALFRLLKAGEKYKLAHPSIIKVAHFYLDDGNERRKLYERWTTMRTFRPKLSIIKKIIAQYNIPVRFLFGRYDAIILSERSAIFKDDIRNVQVHVIEAGHRLVQEKYADDIARLFYQ